jgi:hypothetical protein
MLYKEFDNAVKTLIDDVMECGVAVLIDDRDVAARLEGQPYRGKRPRFVRVFGLKGKVSRKRTVPSIPNTIPPTRSSR